MKGITRAFLLLLVAAVTVALTSHHENEKQAQQEIETVIKESYIDGVHNLGDPELMRRGFHPDFVMLVFNKGELIKMPLQQWIDRIEAGNNKATDGKQGETTYEIRNIDVAGNSAVAGLDVFRNGEHIFTDYMSLYKFEDGWKIVNKIFYRHK